MATRRRPYWFGGTFALNAVTIKKTRKGTRTAHLFVEFIDGAVNGHAVAFCGIVQWPDTKNAYKNWEEAVPGTPLCNHCGRKFHKEHRYWVGGP